MQVFFSYFIKKNKNHVSGTNSHGFFTDKQLLIVMGHIKFWLSAVIGYSANGNRFFFLFLPLIPCGNRTKIRSIRSIVPQELVFIQHTASR